MSLGFDVRALTGLFLDEANEQLATLEATILAFSEGLPDPDQVALAFRAAHSLKGASRTMGHESLGSLAHRLEDRLDAFRNGERLTEQGRTAMLSVVDELRSALGEVSGDSVKPRTFHVTLDPSCALPSIRAELLLRALESCGEVVKTTPERAQLDTNEFDVVIESSFDEGALAGVALSVSEVLGFAEVVDRPSAPDATRSESTVRVPVKRLDRIVDLIGEMVIERSRLARACHLLMAERMGDPLLKELVDVADQMAKLVGDLQHFAMGIRLLPVDGVFRRVARMTHDVAAQLGKDVQIVCEGGETEVDRTVLDILADPLNHMIRNCLDHGIETPEARVAAGKPQVGSIHLRAVQQDGAILIEVEDDGRGIDPERLRRAAVERGLADQATAKAWTRERCIDLIFDSGFSTASTVSEVSGRGVGMDVVRTNAEKVGGKVTVSTESGRGTTFRMILPVSLFIVRSLLVRADSAVYAIPISSVRQTLRTAGSVDLKLADLAAVLDDERDPEERTFAVLTMGQEERVGLMVDQLIAEDDLVVKPLPAWVLGREGLVGASILANGQVVLILEPSVLLEGRDIESLMPRSCIA